MSLSDAGCLEQLKLARDAIVAAIISGARVVNYRVGDLSVTKEPSQDLLEGLDKLIRYYEAKADAAEALGGGRSFASFKHEPTG